MNFKQKRKQLHYWRKRVLSVCKKQKYGKLIANSTICHSVEDSCKNAIEQLIKEGVLDSSPLRYADGTHAIQTSLIWIKRNR